MPQRPAQTTPPLASTVLRRALPAAAALAATLLISGAAPAGAGPAAPTPGGRVTADPSNCARPPAALPAGDVAFEVANPTRDYAAVYLIAPADNDVFAEIRNLPPGTTGALAATLAPGRYALRCVFSDGKVATSSTYTVTGATPQSPTAGVSPMPDLELEGPVDAYRAYVKQALPALLAAARALDADVTRGDLAAARTDWLTAHLDYERLGAAYNSFQDFDAELDGMAQGLPQGTQDPGWTGFFAIEYALYHPGTVRLSPLTHTLVDNIRSLIDDFPSEDIDPGDLPLRAHEILENALQFQLTGLADYGSGTTLATVDANVQGTRAVLGTLSTLIQRRDPALASSVEDWLTRVQAQLAAMREPGGAWPSLADLTTAQRQRLDGYLGALLERLAEVPDLLAPRPSA
jgi:iron uptake system EfeUOB component EfeO/EfeM